MTSLATAFVSIRPDMTGFGARLSQSTSLAADRAGADAGKRMSSKFAGALKVGGILAGAFAVTKGFTFLKDSISEANDLNESINAVNVTFGKNAGGIKRLGNEAANSLGLSKNQFNSLAVQFSGFATTIAGKGGNVVGTMDKLTTRGADFASVMNLDVNEAMRLFQSGLAGETEPLRKFGIDLSAAAVESHAYAKGIAAAGKPLTEQQKVQARYSLLMKATAKTQGDFTNTSDGLANSQRRLGANLDNIQATIGTLVLPKLAALSNVVVDRILPAMTKFFDQMRSGEGAGGRFASIMGRLGDTISTVAGFLIRNKAAVATFVGVLGGFLIFRQITAAVAAFNVVLAANPIGLAVVAVAALAAGLVYAYKNSSKFRAVVDTAFNGVKKVASSVTGWFTRSFVPFFTRTLPGAFQTSVGWVKQNWPVMLAILTGPIGLAVLAIAKNRDKISAGFTDLKNWAVGTFKGAWAKVQGVFTAPVAAARTAIGTTVGKVRSIFGDAKDWALTTWKTAWAKVQGAFTTPVSAARTAIGTTVGNIRRVFGDAKDWALTTWKTAWSKVQGAFTAPVEAARKTFVGLVGVGGRIRTIFGGVKDWALTTWKNAWAKVKGAFNDPVEAARKVFVTLLGKDGRVRTVFNGVKDWAVGTFKTAWGKVAGVFTDPIVAVRKAFDRILGPRGPVRSAFADAILRIGQIWDGLKAKAAAPVRFVVNTVYNNGIRKVVNAIPGVSDLPALKVGFARGGWTGPGSMMQPAGIVHADEFVIRKESRKQIEAAAPGLLDKLNKRGREALHEPIKRMRGYFLGGGVKPAAGSVSQHSRAEYPWARWAGDINEPGSIDMGKPVVAWKSGTVSHVQSLTSSYGKHMKIAHSGGQESLYAHLSGFRKGVGQAVAAGDRIGVKGSTGRSSGPHLHFEVKGGSVNTGDTGGSGPQGMAAGAAGAVGRWVTDIVKHLNPLRFLNLGGWGSKLGGMGAWGGMLGKAVGNIGGKFKGWAADKIAAAFKGAKGILSGGKFFTTENRHFESYGGSASGKPAGSSNAGGSANGLTANMDRARRHINAKFPGHVIYGYSNRNIGGTNTKSDHAYGKALDIMGAKQNIADYFATGPGHRMFNIENTIYNRRIHNARGWHAYNGSSPHTDHVHIDSYDRGGVARGRGALVKNTVRPERVLSPRQTESFDRLVAVLERRGVAGASAPLIGSAVIRETVDLERYEKQRAFRERMTNVGG